MRALPVQNAGSVSREMIRTMIHTKIYYEKELFDILTSLLTWKYIH